MLASSQRRLLGALVAALCGAALIAGCGSSESDGGSSQTSGTTSAATSSTTAAAAKPVDIAFLAYTKTDFTEAGVKGLRSVVEPDGGSVTEFSSNFDPGKQVSQCQDAIASGRYNAIVVVPLDPATPIACVQAAKAANIPVGTIETAVGKDPYDLKPQVPGVVSVVVGTLDTQVVADAQLIEKACGSADPCKVVAEVATANDPFTNQTVAGVAKKLAPHVEIVQKIATQYDPGAMAKALPDVLSAHPDVNVIYTASDQSALATGPALKDKGLAGKVKVIGRGGSTEGVAAIKDGTVFGTTGNWPDTNGEFVGKGLTQAVNGEPVTNVSMDILKAGEPMIITKDNVDEFTPQWGSRH